MDGCFAWFECGSCRRKTQVSLKRGRRRLTSPEAGWEQVPRALARSSWSGNHLTQERSLVTGAPKERVAEESPRMGEDGREWPRDGPFCSHYWKGSATGRLFPPETKNSHLTEVSFFANLAGPSPPARCAWGPGRAATPSTALGRLGVASQATQLETSQRFLWNSGGC